MDDLSPEATNNALTLIITDMEKPLNKKRIPTDLLDQLTQEADVLDSALAAFNKNVKARIVNTCRRRNSLLPISRLPLEVLISIFLEVIEDPDDPDDILNLASVSSFWYHSCLSAPKLWSHFSSDMDVEYTELRLERSGSAPLHVNLLEHDEGYRAERVFFNILTEHAFRWKSLYIDSPYGNRLALDCLADKHLPILESLALYQMDGTDPFHTLKLSAPSLKDLVYHCIHFPLHSGPNLHSNLRKIEIKYTAEESLVEQCRLVFTSAPHLEHISIIDNSDGLDEGPKDASEIQLYNLKTLKLSKLPWDSINSLLSCISTLPDQHPQFSVTAKPHLDPLGAEFATIAGVHSLMSTIRTSEWISVMLTYGGDDDNETTESDEEEKEDEDEERHLLIVTLGIGEVSTKKELLRLKLNCNGDGLGLVFATLMQSGCFSKVRTMEVEGLRILEDTSIWDHSDLPSLEVLRVRPAGQEDLDIEYNMQELIKDLSSPEDSEPNSLLWSRLRHVAFGGCMIDEDSLLQFIRVRCGNTDSTNMTLNPPCRLELIEMEECDAISGGLEYLATRYNVKIRCDPSLRW